jgi:hypothetical protein
MTKQRLSLDSELAMMHIRSRIAPYKSAAIAGILYSEQLATPEEQIKKLRDAIDFLALEIKLIESKKAAE